MPLQILIRRDRDFDNLYHLKINVMRDQEQLADFNVIQHFEKNLLSNDFIFAFMQLLE